MNVNNDRKLRNMQLNTEVYDIVDETTVTNLLICQNTSQT